MVHLSRVSFPAVGSHQQRFDARFNVGLLDGGKFNVCIYVGDGECAKRWFLFALRVIILSFGILGFAFLLH